MQLIPESESDKPFETYRPLMFSIAYRMLGSVMEAEDIVQDAYVRFRTTQTQNIQSHKAFLSAMVVRLCLNQLALASSQREMYVGSWLPEPILTMPENAPLLPEDQIRRYDSISLAFLTLLEKLTPLERAVFLLHEVFDYPFREVAEIVEKEEATCRQLFRRAKKHILNSKSRFKSTPQAHQQILNSFVQAVTDGDLENLLHLLAHDVVMWADGGGVVRGAATQPVYGADAVARFILFSTNYLPPVYQLEIAPVNGQNAIVLRADQRAILVICVETDAVTVRAVRVIANPKKLTRL
jgi:RNA polymerase sigma-70 factor (ECF subfamily)